MDISDIQAFIKEYTFYIKFIGVPLVAIIVDIFQRRLFNRLLKRLARTKSFWDDAIVRALTAPISFIIWVVVVAFYLEIGNRHYDWELAETITVGRSILFILGVMWFFMRLAGNMEKNFIRKLEREKKSKEGIHHIDTTTALALGKVVRVCIIIAAGLVVLPTLGYSISGLLAFGGAGALIVSLAAQNLLSNFFGGLMIYLDRPFAIGDWIRSPDQEIEGSVEHIGWRVTRIRTFDKRPLYVPNAVFTKVSVENPQRMWNRRIKETIGIRYDDCTKMNGIVESIRSYLKEHEAIDQKMITIVAFNEFGPSSLNILVYCFTKTTDWLTFHGIKQEVLLGIADIISKAGAEIAFPTRTLHIADLPSSPEGLSAALANDS